MIECGHTVKAFYKSVGSFVEARGLEWTVKRVKSTRLAATRYLTGHPLKELEGVGLSEGFPNWIADWKPHQQVLGRIVFPSHIHQTWTPGSSYPDLDDRSDPPLPSTNTFCIRGKEAGDPVIRASR